MNGKGHCLPLFYDPFHGLSLIQYGEKTDGCPFLLSCRNVSSFVLIWFIQKTQDKFAERDPQSRRGM